MNKKVIVAGHICIDITPVFPGQKEVLPLSDLLVPGKLIHMDEADVHTGGSVANTGLAMKKFGADVTLMGKIGKDAFGGMVQNILKKYDADQGLLVSSDESTSYSVVIAPPGIDRIFLHHPGANDTFRSGDIPEEALRDTALFHFGYPPIMRSMYENEGQELVRLLERAKQAGAATSLDMAAIDPSSEAGQADWQKILEKVLPLVDFFVPSAEELCFMLDQKRFEQWKTKAAGQDMTMFLDMEQDIKPLADHLMALGAKVLLIKCGVSGMYYRTAAAGELKHLGETLGLRPEGWAGKEGFEKSYIPDKVLSATGAGDTSIAAFLTAMLSGRPIEVCMKLATGTGASCVAAYDALSGLMRLDALEKKINAGWRKRGE